MTPHDAIQTAFTPVADSGDTAKVIEYFHASLSSQFDAVLHFDHPAAVRPLEITPQWTELEVPETCPTGV